MSITDSNTNIDPALRARAAIIINNMDLKGGTLHSRLLTLLGLSDPDLEVLFTQRAVQKYELHNDFDIVFEMVQWKIPFRADTISNELKDAIVHSLETRNWKAAIALMCKAVDDGA
jgi:hypothetical protein